MGWFELRTRVRSSNRSHLIVRIQRKKATRFRRDKAHCNAALDRVVSAENGGKLSERIKTGTPAG